VKLASLVDGEIGLENHFGPGTGACGGRRVGEDSWNEVSENESLIKSNFAGCRVRARDGWVGEGGIGGADLEILRGGYGGEQHEQREKRGGEFRNGGSGHWEPPNIGAKSCRVREWLRSRKAVLVREFSEGGKELSRR